MIFSADPHEISILIKTGIINSRDHGGLTAVISVCFSAAAIKLTFVHLDSLLEYQCVVASL